MVGEVTPKQGWQMLQEGLDETREKHDKMLPVEKVKAKMVGEVTPRWAWQMLQDDPGAILLDVRSKVEFDYVGHPVCAVNVPLQEPPDWQNDPAFADKVIARLGEESKRATVLTLCRSGKRSLLAAELLAEKGFMRTVNIAEGFEGDKDANQHRSNINGWRFHDLPWEQT